MSRSTPNFYVLHGPDEFTCRAQVQAMRAQMGDPGMAELNTSILDGKAAAAAEVLAAASAMALGTYSGGWRIIHTLGTKVIKLDPIHGFAAETSAATVIQATAHLGFPISTTHAISAAIMGAGSTERLSAVRWGVAGRIISAWVITLPACIVLAFIVYSILRMITGHN